MRLSSICALSVMLILQTSISSSAIPAEIKGVATNNGRILVLVTGDIVPGDADTFTTIVKQANSAGKLVVNIRLNSPGGNLLEGVKLADAVRFGKIGTNVGKNATCASACFLVFAAGTTKFANYTARIGVHGASDQSGAETAASEAATVSMAKVARELGVPAAIIGRMVVTPPAEMVWLTPQDLETMGTTMVGKPSQVSIGVSTPGETVAPQTRQSSPSAPLSLEPQTQATAPPPSWDEFIKAATARSAAQNNGTPAYARSCEPELKVCHTGVAFVDKGKGMLAIVTRDIDDKLVSREVCELNELADIRRCLNWDTGAKHSDMKDKNGKWYQVE